MTNLVGPLMGVRGNGKVLKRKLAKSHIVFLLILVLLVENLCALISQEKPAKRTKGGFEVVCQCSPPPCDLPPSSDPGTQKSLEEADEMPAESKNVSSEAAGGEEMVACSKKVMTIDVSESEGSDKETEIAMPVHFFPHKDSSSHQFEALAKEVHCIKEMVTDIRAFLYSLTPPLLPPPLKVSVVSDAIPSNSSCSSSLSVQHPVTDCHTHCSSSFFPSTSSLQSNTTLHNSVLPSPVSVHPSTLHHSYLFPSTTSSVPPAFSSVLPISTSAPSSFCPSDLHSTSQSFSAVDPHLSTHSSQSVTPSSHPSSRSCTTPSSHFVAPSSHPLHSRTLLPLYPTHKVAPFPYETPTPLSFHPVHQSQCALPSSPAPSRSPSPPCPATSTSYSPSPVQQSTPALAPVIPPPTVSPPVHLPPLQFTSEHLASIVNNVRLQSCSRRNFCANMARKLYTLEERKSSNVRGKLGKKQLDAQRMVAIQDSVFKIYPLGVGEKENVAWHQCVKAIDESCRRLNRYKPE